VEGVAALLLEVEEVLGVEGEQPALREALVVDLAGVLALGVGAQERAAEQDLAAGATTMAVALALGQQRLGVLRHELGLDEAPGLAPQLSRFHHQIRHTLSALP